MSATADDDAAAAARLSSRAPTSPHARTAHRAHAASIDTTADSRGAAFRHRRSTSLAFALQSPPSASQPSPPATSPAMVDIPLEEPPTGLLAFYNRNKGLAYVLLAQVFGVLMNVTTRLLEVEGNKGAGMHPFQILLVRMTITTSLSIAYMWYTKTPHFPLGLAEVRWLLILRGIGGFFGVFGMYYSLMFLPLADATVITFISPIISCWACSFLINEPFTRMEQIGAFVSFVGVTLIARPTTFFSHTGAPPSSSPADGPIPADPAVAARAVADYNNVTSAQRFMAVCVALLGVLGQAGAFTAMRWIGKRAHPLLSVTYFCACCTLVSAVAMAVLPDVEFLLPADLKEWTYLIFLGICGFAMQFLLAAGLQHEKSSRATNMVYTQMLFAIIFDKLIFGTNPSLLSLTGSSLILGSAIYIAVQKETMKAQAEQEAKARQAEPTARDVELQETRTRQRRHSRTTSLALREESAGLVAGMDADDNDDDDKDLREGGPTRQRT